MTFTCWPLQSWLCEDEGDEILREVFSAGYVSLQKPQVGRRGGGVAIICRDFILIRLLHLDYAATSFEFMAASLTINSTFLSYSSFIALLRRSEVISLMNLRVFLKHWGLHQFFYLSWGF
jgi:hypothetical protein